MAMFSLLCLASGCGKENQPGRPNASPSGANLQVSPQADAANDEVYDVYDALLGGPSSRDEPASRGPIAIEDHTVRRELCFDPASKVDLRLRAAGKDFIRQNSESRPLDGRKFKLGQKMELLSSTELGATFSQGPFSGWKQFHQNHPAVGGFITLSAVGFNEAKDFAMVFSSASCGPLCGAGRLSTFSKKDGVWRKNNDQLCSWIS